MDAVSLPASAPIAQPQNFQPTLAALRAATAVHHAAIEKLLPFDGTLTLPRYRRAMQAFDAFLSAWEPMLAQALAPSAGAWFLQRTRGALARDDLRALGIPRTTLSDALAIDLPGTAAAFGSLYVMEGSALGGQLIARLLCEKFGIDASRGGAYMAGWGPRTGAMWREFRERLEAEVGDDPRGHEDACRAAVQTFDALADAFRELAP